MAKSKYKGSRTVLTANDLSSGKILFWTGDDWSKDFTDAQVALDEGQGSALEATGKQAEQSNRVVGSYLIAVTPQGQPLELREAVRLQGALATTQDTVITEKLKVA